MWIPTEEYNKIKKTFPIPCVDLIVQNERGEILLVKRKNEPAKNEWWFPGGRVLFGESRRDAAIRKLKEECGIVTENPIEWKTFDIFLADEEENYQSHGVSTFYLFDVNRVRVVLDKQSSDHAWNSPQNWLQNLPNTQIAPFLKALVKENNLRS